ncbi:MAG: sigma-70 family RNA polymerase sigma factor [Balneolales bacterium]
MSILILLSVLNRKSHDENESLLLTRIAEGDEEALARLYDLYSGILFGLIRTIVKNSETAEDLLQEIFLLIWKRAASFDPSKGSVYTWLITLTRNKSIDKIRSKSYRMQQQHLSDEQAMPFSILVSNEKSPHESMWLDEKTEIIKNALNKIPAKQRKVIEIAFYEGLSQSKISEMYHIPLGTVKTRMRQGLEKLQVLLKNSEEMLR